MQQKVLLIAYQYLQLHLVIDSSAEKNPLHIATNIRGILPVKFYNFLFVKRVVQTVRLSLQNLMDSVGYQSKCSHGVIATMVHCIKSHAVH